MWLFTSKTFLSVVADKDQPDGPKLLVRSRVQGDIEEVFPDADVTEPPPTKVEGFSGLERLRRTVGSFPTEVGGFKPDFWKMKRGIARKIASKSLLYNRTIIEKRCSQVNI